MTGKIRRGLHMGPQLLFGAVVVVVFGVTCFFLLIQTWM
jgi:hypothetical protein